MTSTSKVLYICRLYYNVIHFQAYTVSIDGISKRNGFSVVWGLGRGGFLDYDCRTGRITETLYP